MNLPLCVSPQVVELISSAIGDVVQGLYYENYSNSEVKKLFYKTICQIIKIHIGNMIKNALSAMIVSSIQQNFCNDEKNLPIYIQLS